MKSETVHFRVDPDDKKLMDLYAVELSYSTGKRVSQSILYQTAVKEYIENHGLRDKAYNSDNR